MPGEVRRWLDAAERMRERARVADERAAGSGSPAIAGLLERQAEVHREAAEAFESFARASFERSERRIERAQRRAQRGSG